MSPVSRRSVLAGAAAVAAVPLAAGCSAVPVEATGGPPTYVLVGGSAAPSFFWMPLVRELSLRGARSHPVELPGHGLEARFPDSYQTPQDVEAFAAYTSPVVGAGLDDYAGAVVDVLRRVSEHGPVVLLGHSLGGIVITRVADTVPDLVDHLVYVSGVAVTPPGGALEVFASPENAGSLAATIPATGGHPAATGVTRANLRSSDPRFLDAFRQALLADVDADRFLAALNYLQQPDESVLPTLEDVRADPRRWGRIPRTFVRLTADRWHLPALQDRIVADADRLTPGNPFSVHDLDSSHLGFIVNRAGELADLLVGIGR